MGLLYYCESTLRVEWRTKEKRCCGKFHFDKEGQREKKGPSEGRQEGGGGETGLGTGWTFVVVK